MTKIAVVYWSGTGNTEAMANEVVAGAQAAGAEASMLTCDEFGPAETVDYDAFALGCPAMGDEVLEESEFEPMYESVKDLLEGKKVVLFGSYDWGTGEWMETWEEDARNAGINVVGTVIANLEPDDDACAACQQAGASLA